MQNYQYLMFISYSVDYRLNLVENFSCCQTHFVCRYNAWRSCKTWLKHSPSLAWCEIWQHREDSHPTEQQRSTLEFVCKCNFTIIFIYNSYVIYNNYVLISSYFVDGWCVWHGTVEYVLYINVLYFRHYPAVWGGTQSSNCVANLLNYRITGIGNSVNIMAFMASTCTVSYLHPCYFIIYLFFILFYSNQISY
jgi:hypothetical protein